jgi:hypothetical protein
MATVRTLEYECRTSKRLDDEFERCGNCAFTRFMHKIVPDIGVNPDQRMIEECPTGIGAPKHTTHFRRATREDYIRWREKL